MKIRFGGRRAGALHSEVSGIFSSFSSVIEFRKKLSTELGHLVQQTFCIRFRPKIAIFNQNLDRFHVTQLRFCRKNYVKLRKEADKQKYCYIDFQWRGLQWTWKCRPSSENSFPRRTDKEFYFWGHYPMDSCLSMMNRPINIRGLTGPITPDNHRQLDEPINLVSV